MLIWLHGAVTFLAYIGCVWALAWFVGRIGLAALRSIERALMQLASTRRVFRAVLEALRDERGE